MSKKSRRQSRQSRRTSNKAKNARKLLLKRIGAVCIASFGLIGTYLTIFGFWMPRISVQPPPISDPKEPLALSFTVSNQGYMSLNNVRIGCRPVNFHMRLLNAPEYEILEAAEPDSMFESIAPMKSAASRCFIAGQPKPDFDVELVVHYRPALYPFEQEESFRFSSRSDSEGRIYWLPRPDSPSPKTPEL